MKSRRTEEYPIKAQTSGRPVRMHWGLRFEPRFPMTQLPVSTRSSHTFVFPISHGLLWETPQGAERGGYLSFQSPHLGVPSHPCSYPALSSQLAALGYISPHQAPSGHRPSGWPEWRPVIRGFAEAGQVPIPRPRCLYLDRDCLSGVSGLPPGRAWLKAAAPLLPRRILSAPEGRCSGRGW